MTALCRIVLFSSAEKYFQNNPRILELFSGHFSPLRTIKHVVRGEKAGDAKKAKKEPANRNNYSTGQEKATTQAGDGARWKGNPKCH